MNVFFKNRISVSSFELGFEIVQGLGSTIGSTTFIGKVVAIVMTFFSITTPEVISVWSKSVWRYLPIALTTARLFDTLWISVNVTRFGKVSWKTILRNGRTVSKTSVITIVCFDTTSHY